jgi:hypothetical protein
MDFWPTLDQQFLNHKSKAHLFALQSLEVADFSPMLESAALQPNSIFLYILKNHYHQAI